MFWQIIRTDQLHKASQLLIHYLENTSTKQEINQLTDWDRGTNAQMSLPTHPSNENGNHPQNPELSFPLHQHHRSCPVHMQRQVFPAVLPYEPPPVRRPAAKATSPRRSATGARVLPSWVGSDTNVEILCSGCTGDGHAALCTWGTAKTLRWSVGCLTQRPR